MEKMKYRISSRATILLGRESVSKVDGAIIELVKNTYDADATLCFICFDIENDCIYILDNGIGMTREIIENCWMMIGTDNKRENYKSVKNRIKSGEKGIGRFALDRLGSQCDMYTKNKEEQLILWRNDWSKFEEPGKTIDQIEADFEYLDKPFKQIIPSDILESINSIKEKKLGVNIELETGTLLKISNLRDTWTQRELNSIFTSLGFLIPPTEQREYIICAQKSLLDPYFVVENEVSEEYDYRLSAEFDGEVFKITLNRNEFDLNQMPKDLFEIEDFKISPYRHQDFKNKIIYYEYTIPELMRNKEKDYQDAVRKIGSFKFDYTFMKLSLAEDDKESFFYKQISKKRRIWLEHHNGIKIYRDNFLVRPYGDPKSDSFDWLGIDARMAKNPAAVSHPSGNWHVRNRQGQGTLFISRINNDSILDKSSREGIIENEYFNIFKDVIKNIISVFERDRAYIARTIKKYKDIISEKEQTKQSGAEIADKYLKDREKDRKRKESTVSKEKLGQPKQSEQQEQSEQPENFETLAKAVQYFQEEREELISEIKLLRELSTNGLITTSIVHDLKSINAILVNRVDSLKFALDNDNKTLINRCLEDLRKNDIFLKSWITVITNQKKDKRKRTKKNLYETVKNLILLLEPILNQKKIKVNIKEDNKEVFKRIYVSDFESIVYNLIINSIEAFEKTKTDERIINITMETKSEFILHYEDNGSGLSDTFKNPYDIFNYGVTSKNDINGNPIGTGLGMYIVASTLREYNAKYNITKYTAGFGLELKFSI
ncbi:ATP-binding protein [Bacillus cereus group sp. BfR-BA-01380]|uniref:ATP-binding protein n=1 Tax=Bacillus cereus group sp. BfR-BA-01380 TaxID=2920324 RepID=UPI001F570842|nr:ATP-binding protein [Bacillus cereus group sp. BfR-BA-01380]